MTDSEVATAMAMAGSLSLQHSAVAAAVAKVDWLGRGFAYRMVKKGTEWTKRKETLYIIDDWLSASMDGYNDLKLTIFNQDHWIK